MICYLFFLLLDGGTTPWGWSCHLQSAPSFYQVPHRFIFLTCFFTWVLKYILIIPLFFLTFFLLGICICGGSTAPPPLRTSEILETIEHIWKFWQLWHLHLLPFNMLPYIWIFGNYITLFETFDHFGICIWWGSTGPSHLNFWEP